MIQFVAMKRIIAGRNSSMVIISTGRRGAQVAQSVKRLPSGQAMIPGSWDWDQASSQAPCSAESPPLPLPLPLPPLVLSLSLK